MRNRTGGALLVLVLLHFHYAGLVVSTGVPDYEIQAQAQKEINRQAEQLKADEDSQELATAIDALEKRAAFNRVFGSVLLQVGGPARLLIGVGLTSSLLFLAVAVWGAAKADFRQLAAVAVFACFAEVPRLAMRLFLIAKLQVMRVETSAAAFVSDPRQAGLGTFLLLRRLDPFALWYWGLVALGLWKTGMMTGKRAVVVAVVLGFLTALVQCNLDLPELADMSEMMKMQEDT